ncbi:MAG: YidC/Oxa1 family membrane protein insertase [Caldisericia bacterium]|nr:YidC/Oxa1 family membrane protein insertase [Caldisericia bacterium]MDD4614103.1 YidC/Oxa1 family membrane protein insertase [Caldisericia bacterium]
MNKIKTKWLLWILVVISSISMLGLSGCIPGMGGSKEPSQPNITAQGMDPNHPIAMSVNAMGKEGEVASITIKVENLGALINNLHVSVGSVDGTDDVSPFVVMEDMPDLSLRSQKLADNLPAGEASQATYIFECPEGTPDGQYNLQMTVTFTDIGGEEYTVTDIFYVSISRPWFYFITIAMRRVLDFLSGGSAGLYGLGIILFTLLLKLLLWPVSKTTMKSQEQMSKIQPKINEINKKYKDNPERKNELIMDLYKQENINPMSGCLPMLPQLLVLWVLYTALQGYIPLYRASFLWCPSLGMPDPYYIFPILAGVSTFLQSYTGPQGKDPQTKSMMYMMPIFFFIIMMRFPAALSMFWTVYGLFSWGQQAFMNHQKKKNALSQGPVELK